MGARIALILLIIVLCVGGYFFWVHYNQQHLSADGAVTCTGCMTPEEKARFDKENSGDVADGNSEHKIRSARAEDAAGNPEGAVAAGQVGTPGAAPYRTGTTNQLPPATGNYVSTSAAGPLPAYDSQPPNAPNNLRFGGSGSYQWYRQGNLTWRVDTVTGASCIAFATMEEWRKQIVYSHGCGRGA